jgi:hypothetical protein
VAGLDRFRNVGSPDSTPSEQVRSGDQDTAIMTRAAAGAARQAVERFVV